ncbi:MAG: protein kinase [Planctomycetes bacterium]|nr:protein kinase [Planctomycetota bacterium]
MNESADRLERALGLFVAHRLDGGDWQQVLAGNPELADLLTAMCGDEDATVRSSDPPAPSGPVSSGGELLGDYRLGRIVGQGGTGRVHEARDRLLGRRVAVKVLLPDVADSATALVRFRREAQTLARLDHPEIVRVLGVGETGGRHWLAMEFVDGVSLAARIDQLAAAGGHTGDSLRHLVMAIARIAQALHHAHEAGVVHRDVKPSNILLRSDGHPVLTDFGIARDRGDPSLTNAGAVLGSPRYMSPEQVLHGGAACDRRSDVFSLGATLYECATLRPAFAGPSIAASLAAIVRDDPPDPRRLNRGVPADLAAIVMKALEKEPERRYATADAFAGDLRAFLDLREVTARAPSRMRRMVRRMRRQPAVAGLALLAMIALAMSVWIGVQWPQLRAAAAAERQRAYDDAVVNGFLARGDAAAERRWFEQAIRGDPSRSEAVLGLVFAASRSRGPAAALAELEARPMDDGDENLARCRAWLLERVQRQPEADALRRSLGPPTSSMGLWLEALLGIEGREADPGALGRARDLLSLAVRISPRPNLVLYAQWAAVVCNGGGPAERREVAEALSRIWPEHPLALQLSGACLVSLEPERAEQLLRRALSLGGANAHVQANLGLALMRRGDLVAALAMLRDAFHGMGSDVPMRRRLLAIVAQIDDAVAGELANDWLAVVADEPAALRFAGRAAWRRGDHETALDLMRRAVAANGDELEARLDLAFALVSADAAAEAVENLAALSRSHPDHERVHAQLLDALDAAGDAPAALAEHRRWAERRPDDAAAWLDYATALSQSPQASGDDRELAVAERADELAKGVDQVARELHAKALDRRGEHGAAALVRSRPTRALTR